MSKVQLKVIDTNNAERTAAASTGNIFRQTRHENQVEHVTVKIGDEVAKLKNWSRTGLGFHLRASHLKYNVGDRIPDVVISFQDIVLYQGPIEIKRADIEDEVADYGAVFAGSLFLVDSIEAASTALDCARAIEDIHQAYQSAEPAFCQSVLVLASALRHIEMVCRTEESRWRRLNFDQKCEAERIFVPNVAHKIKTLFVHFNIKIASQIDVDQISEESPYHKIFHEQIYPFFEGADFIRRAFEKPRGYAGDYEMMNQIYRNGFEGNDLFGRVLHHYMTNENGPESVRFRIPLFLKYYRSLLSRVGTQRVLAVACGPAVEVQELIMTWTAQEVAKLDITLFDLDREALEHAQAKIIETSMKLGKSLNVTYQNANVKALLTSSASSQTPYDLIYSGGLFDYLDNMTSTALLRKFVDLLRPGGTVVIGNFTKDNLSKAFQHLLTKWTMIHKTEQEMRDWAKDVEGCQVVVEYDPHHMNAFLVVKKDVF